MEPFVADLHSDTMMWPLYDASKRHNPSLPLSPLLNHVDEPRLAESCVSLQAFGIVANPWYRPGKSGRKQIGKLRKLVDGSGNLEWALTAEDAERIWREGKTGVFAGLEGAHILDNDPANLEWFYEHGARYLGMSHFLNNKATKKGLTGYGKELVDACDDLGMIIDLAHSNRDAFFSVLEETKNPVIVSHTGIRSVHDSPRNMDDGQVMAIGDNGGVIGIMYFPLFLRGRFTGSVNDIVDHMDRVKELIGADHIALGSDFDGFITLPREMKDVRDVKRIEQAMWDRGYKPDEIRKILGENFLRVYRKVNP